LSDRCKGRYPCATCRGGRHLARNSGGASDRRAGRAQVVGAYRYRHAGDRAMRKQNLVVIGNGMAGARTVEEILARGGAQQFDITMFGEEPTGNYNRILLSNVLNGSYQEEEIYLNPLSWYVENNIFLHAGKRAAGLLTRAKVVFGEDGRPEPYDKLIIATGSRPFLP